VPVLGYDAFHEAAEEVGVEIFRYHRTIESRKPHHTYLHRLTIIERVLQMESRLKARVHFVKSIPSLKVTGLVDVSGRTQRGLKTGEANRLLRKHTLNAPANCERVSFHQIQPERGRK